MKNTVLIASTVLMLAIAQPVFADVSKADIIDYVNQYRIFQRHKPVRESAVLDKAAQAAAEDMAKRSYFNHCTPEQVSKDTPQDKCIDKWLEEAGYEYTRGGQNLAVLFTDSSALVGAWIKSPTHNRIMLDAPLPDGTPLPPYTETGVGIAYGQYKGFSTAFVVQYFGRPKSADMIGEIAPERSATGQTATTSATTTTTTSSPATAQPRSSGAVTVGIISLAGLLLLGICALLLRR